MGKKRERKRRKEEKVKSKEKKGRWKGEREAGMEEGRKKENCIKLSKIRQMVTA